VIIVQIAVFATAIVLLASGSRWLRTRQERLVRWAHQHNLSFSKRNDRSFDLQFPHFRYLRQGLNRTANNIARGMWNNRQLVAFDYHFVTGYGRTGVLCEFSAIILENEISLKPLLIRPEKIRDKIAEFFGHNDIDFESAKFSRRFYVKGSDRRWAYAVLHAEMMAFLLRNPRFTVEMGGNHIMVCAGGLFTPKKYEAAIAIAEGILEQLPKYNTLTT
jgi:hypothetical protein